MSANATIANNVNNAAGRAANGERFAGKYAVVTGGTRGIGLAVADRMAAEGLAGAVLVGRDASKAQESAAELADRHGCDAIGLAADVADPGAVKELFRQVRERLPRLDVLVNSAGIYTTTPLGQLDAGEWDRVLDVNLRGAHLCVREAAAIMEPQRSGAIVNISSLAARVGGVSGSVAYAASKGGMLSATRSYAKILAPYGVRVNAVCPGVIRTDMTAGTDFSSLHIPLGRLGEVGDVAGVVAFLASDDAAYVTGQAIDVNGGVYMN